MPTPLHAVRVPDDLWGAALRHAQETGTDVSTAIRALLNAWISGEITLFCGGDGGHMPYCTYGIDRNGRKK